MIQLNPYNCTKPGNIFVGYERLRRQILNGYINGNSYAIIGGRRCGKTSFLLQLEKDIKKLEPTPFHCLPRFLDIQSMDKITPTTLFQKIYSLITEDTEAPFLEISESGQDYQQFLFKLKTAQPILDKKYGKQWLVILLIDEIDSVLKKLPDDTFFQNIRNFLMQSDFRSYFRITATGVKEMSELISSGSSPLNNLRGKYLHILTSSQAHELISTGFQDSLNQDIENWLFILTGKHPFLLQGLLEKMLEYDHSSINYNTLKNIAWEFLKEHNDFQRWLQAFSDDEHAVYQCLSRTVGGRMHISEISNSISQPIENCIDDALTVLSYHGVIDDSNPEEPQIAGTMFKDWYWNNFNKKFGTSRLKGNKKLKLFFSYSHKDEQIRESLETHLALLRRQGLIENWHDRNITAGTEWHHEIDENLQNADIILLLISADFLASDYCYDLEMRKALQRHKDGDAKVIPIICRSVDWSMAPFSKLQALPKDGKPITKWDDQDEAWTNVSQGIRKVISELLRSKS